MSAPAPTAQLDVLALLRGGIKRIVLLAVVAGLGATAYAFLASPWYTSTLVVVPTPAPKTGGAASLLSGAAASTLDIPVELGGGPSDIERIGGVLRSRTVTDAVIAKFDLQRRYKLKYLDQVRNELWEHCSIRVDKKPGLVTLACEDESAVTARDIAAHFGDVGNKTFRRVSASAASEERRFLEQRVAESRQDVERAAVRLQEFGEKHRVVDLSEQSKAVVAAMATVRAELLAKQMQLSFMSGVGSRDESSVEQLRRQVGILEAKLQSLEGQRYGTDAEAPEPPVADGKAAAKKKKAPASQPASVFPPATSVPRLRHEAERLFRDQKVQEALFAMLTQQFERARISEARDTSTFQILDAPLVAQRKSRPKRVLIICSGLMVGLLFGVAWVLGGPWLRTMLRKPAVLQAEAGGRRGKAGA
jgi:tyrosine-protein kinase Etk/Wzc